MEEILVAGVLLLGMLAFVGIGMGIYAAIRLSGLASQIGDLARRLNRLEEARRGEVISQAPAPPPKAEPAAATVAPVITLPPPFTPSAAAPPAAGPRPVAAIVANLHAATAQSVPAAPAATPSAQWLRSLERRIGQRWMTWVGAVVMLFGAGFFVKYAFDSGWIGHLGRVIIGLLLGVALLAGGDRAIRRIYVPLGQGLIGAGLGVLYLALFAGCSLWRVVPQSVGFGAMVVVTVAGMALALLHNGIAISILATLGGFLTPILLSTGEDRRDVLFAYIMLLNLAVLGVAFWRNWIWLDLLAFAGTVVLYGGWYGKFYAASALLPAMLWLGGFYVIFLVLPFIPHLRRRESAPWPHFLLALGNAVFAFVLAYLMLKRDHRQVLGFCALGMTAAYMILGSLTRVRAPLDRKQFFGLVGMAVTFLTTAAPLHFGADGITLAWAVEGPLLLFIGYRYHYLPLRLMAFLVLCLAAVYGLVRAWPTHDLLFTLFWNPKFATAMACPAAMAVFALVHWRSRLAEGEGGVLSTDGVLHHIAACMGALIALVLVDYETRQWLHLRGVDDYYRACLSVFIWGLGGVALAAAGLRWGSVAARISSLAALATSCVMAALLLSREPGERHILFLNARFGTWLAGIGALVLAGVLWRWWRDRRAASEEAIPIALWALGGLALLVETSVESYQFSRNWLSGTTRGEWMAVMSVSLVWAVYASAVLGAGVAWRIPALRYVGLGLFAATVAKLFIVDVWTLKEIFRWIAFFATGVLLIGGSYLYYRIEAHMREKAPEATV
jgi:uncharacterized membrane protein